METIHSRSGSAQQRVLLLMFLLLTVTIVGLGTPSASALRLRAEANLSAPAIALITPGDAFTGHELIFGDPYDDGMVKPEIVLPENPLVGYVTTGGTVLNVRSGPGLSYTTVAQINGGSLLTVLKSENGWCEILFQNALAYVSSDYVRVMTQVEYDTYKSSTDYRGEQIVAAAQEHLGKPYVYGGNGPDSFDCSGFTKYMYAQFGHTLNRTATDQLQNGVSVEKDELQAGDLVFFRSEGTVKPVSHVGIYVGEGSFIHASTNQYQIRIDKLDSGYFSEIYVYGRHIS